MSDRLGEPVEPRHGDLLAASERWHAKDLDEAFELLKGWCQANANKSLKCEASVALGRQLAPLGQGGGAVLLEDVAAVEVTFEVEMVVDRGVDGSEFL